MLWMSYTKKRKVVKILTKKNDEKKRENKELETEVEETKKEASEENCENQCADEKSEDIKKLEEAEAKLKEMEEKYLRLAAEYKNYQNRSVREKDELYSKSVADTVLKLLPVLDSVDRALVSSKEATSVDDVYSGIELIKKMTVEVFEGIGIEEIEAVGKPFDANYHNAVMHIDDEQYGENEVVEEFQKGYKMKDKVIRYSMVKVAN